MRIASCVLLCATLASVTTLASRPIAGTPILTFHTDEFWLNLHHFLYVLGRAENKTRDSARDAVADAPRDAAQMTLADDERAAWQDAVHAYAAGASRKDAVFDDPLPTIATRLAAAGNAPILEDDAIPEDIRTILGRVAPIYRRAWWPGHLGANQKWADEQRSLVEAHGREVLEVVTRAYEMEWPAGGYPVHVSAYANWAGAYSTDSGLLVASSLDPSTRGADGLEIAVHEGMHQWDAQMEAMLKQRAARLGTSVPPNLSHALIFFTAGEAVHRAIPAHVPYADAHGVWQRGWLPLRSALVEGWAPYLAGRVTRDEAIDELLRRMSATK